MGRKKLEIKRAMDKSLSPSEEPDCSRKLNSSLFSATPESVLLFAPTAASSTNSPTPPGYFHHLLSVLTFFTSFLVRISCLYLRLFDSNVLFFDVLSWSFRLDSAYSLPFVEFYEILLYRVLIENQCILLMFYNILYVKCVCVYAFN